MNMNIPDLIFQTPTFNIGYNVTVRRGVFWSMHKKAFVPAINNEIDISTVVIKFEDIPEEILKYNHDINARTLDNLYNVMNECYGDYLLQEEIVTIVGFYINKYDYDLSKVKINKEE